MTERTGKPARKAWRKPRLVEHGDLVALTRQNKGGNGTDSGLGSVS